MNGISGGSQYPMFDYPGRRPAAIPHQLVEVGDMDHQHPGIVYPMPGVGWMLPGRVMLQVNHREIPLSNRQDFELVFEVIPFGLE